MVVHRRFLFILMVTVLFASSCTKPVLIGSDLLDHEKDSLKVTDNLDISFFTQETDSVIVHSDNVTLQLSTYLCGNLDDPIFGSSTAEIYAQPLLGTDATRLIGTTLDSIVLQLVYDTSGLYGSLSDPVTLEVYRMDENPAFETEYFSNERFSSGALLGSKTFIPAPFDSVTVMNPGTNPQRVAPSIRIPLSTVLLDLANQEESVLNNQDTFLQYFKGVHIKMTGAPNTMLGFNILNQSSIIRVYYTADTTTSSLPLVFTTGAVKTVYMEHDYTGSLVGASLTPEPESEYWFVQGMSGVTTTMKINSFSAIGNAIINLAELDVYCTFPPGDVPDLYPPVKYLVTQEMTDTSIINSIDASIALSRVSGNLESDLYKFLYGGKLEQVVPGPEAIYRYSMKITAQVKDIYLGRKENIIYFNPFEKANVPKRSVMFGPGHPEYAPRLRIYYTSL